MRWTSLVVALFAATLSFESFAADKIILNTEDYPPYQTKDAKGAISGENVKIVTELFKRAGIPLEIKMDVWQKSYETARTNAGQAVFTTTRTPEREPLFHWVGPLSVSRSVLLAKVSKKIQITKLEEAFTYRIGGVKEDMKTIYLEKRGAKVDAIDQDAKNAKRLQKGEIDLWATGYISGMKFAKDIGFTDVEEVFVYREDFGYLALNLETKSQQVLELNRILDQMRSEGLLNSALKFKQ